jgi:hypothetical protein
MKSNDDSPDACGLFTFVPQFLQNDGAWVTGNAARTK